MANHAIHFVSQNFEKVKKFILSSSSQTPINALASPEKAFSTPKKVIMKTMRAVKASVLTVVGLMAFSLTGYSQNLLTNGDFEQPTLAPGEVRFFTAPTAFPGFTVTAGSVDINRGVFPAFSGSQALDLVGNDLGTIRQTFSTTAGQAYTLTFVFANNPFDAFTAANPAFATATLFNGAAQIAFTTVSHFDSTTSNMDYVAAALTFSAQGPQTILQFQALNQGATPSANGGIVIDAVSVVPEPTSLTLISIGGGLVTLLALKRRRFAA